MKGICLQSYFLFNYCWCIEAIWFFFNINLATSWTPLLVCELILFTENWIIYNCSSSFSIFFPSFSFWLMHSLIFHMWCWFILVIEYILTHTYFYMFNSSNIYFTTVHNVFFMFLFEPLYQVMEVTFYPWPSNFIMNAWCNKFVDWSCHFFFFPCWHSEFRW
jgi:hypothetical protein